MAGMLARGSGVWIGGAAFFTIVSFLVLRFLSASVSFLALLLGGVVLVFLLAFFRDPERVPRGGEGEAVSPADGRVILAEGRRVNVFMNISDVHVNRTPLGGRIRKIDYQPGSFVPAFNWEAWQNERNYIILSTRYGEVELTQIAGKIARRIVSYVKEGDEVARGQRIGMIRFGSRVDVLFPPGFELAVKKGEQVRAGETVIARWKGR